MTDMSAGQVVPTPPAAESKSGPGPLVWIIPLAGGLAFLGTFLPWATVSSPFFGSNSVSGVEYDTGWFVIVMGVVLVALGGVRLMGRAVPAVAPLLASGLLLAFAIWRVVEVFDAERETQQVTAPGDLFGLTRAFTDGIEVSVGIGLWLVLAAAVIGLVGSLLQLARRS